MTTRRDRSLQHADNRGQGHCHDRDGHGPVHRGRGRARRNRGPVVLARRPEAEDAGALYNRHGVHVLRTFRGPAPGPGAARRPAAGSAAGDRIRQTRQVLLDGNGTGVVQPWPPRSVRGSRVRGRVRRYHAVGHRGRHQARALAGRQRRGQVDRARRLGVANPVRLRAYLRPLVGTQPGASRSAMIGHVSAALGVVRWTSRKTSECCSVHLYCVLYCAARSARLLFIFCVYSETSICVPDVREELRNDQRARSRYEEKLFKYMYHMVHCSYAVSG